MYHKWVNFIQIERFEETVSTALMCPQCNAPLQPSRFARQVTCAYCGAVVQLGEPVIRREIFRQAFLEWNDPQSHSFTDYLSLGYHHWAPGGLLARGSSCDVYRAQRARWPSELVILKVLRDHKDAARLENEWQALQTLQGSRAPGAETFARRAPQPVLHGTVSGGIFAGQSVSLFRWEAGFHHTFEAVQRNYPQGIPPRASIWVWRRILETLSFIHNTGLVHGAILPPHLLVQQNDHGVRLVGYGCAGVSGQPLAVVQEAFAAYYPPGIKPGTPLSPALDLGMSARCLVGLLGGDPARLTLPASIPAPLATLLQRVAHSPGAENAWALREELGHLSDQVFGAPQFNPIVMPS